MIRQTSFPERAASAGVRIGGSATINRGIDRPSDVRPSSVRWAFGVDLAILPAPRHDVVVPRRGAIIAPLRDRLQHTAFLGSLLGENGQDQCDQAEHECHDRVSLNATEWIRCFFETSSILIIQRVSSYPNRAAKSSTDPIRSWVVARRHSHRVDLHGISEPCKHPGMINPTFQIEECLASPKSRGLRGRPLVCREIPYMVLRTFPDRKYLKCTDIRG